MLLASVKHSSDLRGRVNRYFLEFPFVRQVHVVARVGFDDVRLHLIAKGGAECAESISPLRRAPVALIQRVSDVLAGDLVNVHRHEIGGQSLL